MQSLSSSSSYAEDHQTGSIEKKSTMTNVKKLTAVTILSALVANPAFAHATHHSRAYDVRNFRESYNQLGTPQMRDDLNIQYFGLSGRDRSRVGGEDPSLRPSGS